MTGQRRPDAAKLERAVAHQILRGTRDSLILVGVLRRPHAAVAASLPRLRDRCAGASS